MCYLKKNATISLPHRVRMYDELQIIRSKEEPREKRKVGLDMIDTIQLLIWLVICGYSCIATTFSDINFHVLINCNLEEEESGDICSQKPTFNLKLLIIIIAKKTVSNHNFMVYMVLKYEDIVKFHLCKLPSMEIQRIHSNFYSTLLGAKYQKVHCIHQI